MEEREAVVARTSRSRPLSEPVLGWMERGFLWNGQPSDVAHRELHGLTGGRIAVCPGPAAQGVQDYAVYNAFAILSVQPLLIVYLLLERRVVESIVSGAVK